MLNFTVDACTSVHRLVQHLTLCVFCLLQALDEAIEILREHASPVASTAPVDITSSSSSSTRPVQPQATAFPRQNSLVEELTDLISSATPSVDTHERSKMLPPCAGAVITQ